MPLELEGITYHTAAEVVEELGITRQTLWRWRREDKIPPGHRFRDRRLLFTQEELDEIHEFANRVEPEVPVAGLQMRLFNGGERG